MVKNTKAIIGIKPISVLSITKTDGVMPLKGDIKISDIVLIHSIKACVLCEAKREVKIRIIINVSISISAV
jgi:hypothetical protein